MSKELIERLRQDHSDAGAYNTMQEAADLIEQQQREIERLNNNLLWSMEVTGEQQTQLAAAQAQIKVLRDALENVEGALDESGMYQHYPVTYDLFIEALDTPTDDSALREMLAKERERCAKVCDETMKNHYMEHHSGTKEEAFLVAAVIDCAAAIRAMGSE